MDQVLRDPIWQFIGVLTSMLALVVAVLAIRYQQQRKALGYHLSFDSPVFYLFNKALRDRLVVTLDGNPVSGLSTREVSFFNLGNTPITPADFVEPLSVKFEDELRVLGVAVSDAHPENLGASVSNAGNTFVVSPVLLNPGDEFVLQFLVEEDREKYSDSPMVSGRIAGVQRLEARSSRPRARYRIEYYGFRAVRAAPYFVLGIIASWGASLVYRWIDATAK
ncbi:hypothetical protein C7389_10846 [Azoarcus indigens]|uniref:Uncharacterized protein n=1 Tax=Azoarcus indigens TaxID=29545 RepID=A0A4R6DZK8_9RHOO|nr:hypothetical protein C7389_10846 [Azoarcus indigens]